MKPSVPSLAALVASAALLSGCDAARPQAPSEAPAGDAPAGSSSPPGPSAPNGDAAPEPAGPKLPRPSATEAAGFAKASNAFAFDLYRPLAKRGGNLVFSPASVATAMAMTWGGAAKATGDEMRKVMHFAGTPDEVLGAAGRLGADLQSQRAPILAMVNRLFGEKTFAFQKAYLESTEKQFGAPLEPLDFVGAPQPSRKHVNDWVSARTKDRIKDLIPESGIDDQTRLVLVNAVYFLGDWAEPFQKEGTRGAAFFADGTTEKQVPTMNKSDHLPTAEVDGTRVVELPYVGGRFALLLAVPAKPDGLPALEASLDVALYERWTQALTSQLVFLSLPKLEIDPPQSIALKDALVALGMKLAFDRAQADFTKIADPPSPADRLYIGNVFHKAFVKVDEKGTEAAAATAVVMPRAGGMPPKPTTVQVDRPFLLFLRDRQSGLILFAGRVTDPSKKG